MVSGTWYSSIDGIVESPKILGIVIQKLPRGEGGPESQHTTTERIFHSQDAAVPDTRKQCDPPYKRSIPDIGEDSRLCSSLKS